MTPCMSSSILIKAGQVASKKEVTYYQYTLHTNSNYFMDIIGAKIIIWQNLKNQHYFQTKPKDIFNGNLNTM